MSKPLAKYRLFAPGPTPVPEAVRLRMAESVLHHRTRAFEEVFARVRDGLRWVFQAHEEVLCLSGSGTAAMDAAVSNFLSRGDTAIYINGGKFGERWGEILAAYGCKAVEIKVAWGHAVEVEKVAAALEKHPEARAVFVQGCETSTGVAHPVAEISKLCASRAETLSVVDGITAVGVSDVAHGRDNIDILLSGSQKAFMLPPGLAFIAVSDKAWQRAARSDLPKYYLNLAHEKKAAVKNQSAWTSAVSLMNGLDASLALMREEGLENIFARHARMASATRAGLCGLGFELYASPPANGVTAAIPPKGVRAEALIQQLQDHYNLTVVGGQDEAKGKIVRVAHMGYFDHVDVLTVLATIENALIDLGHRPPAGAGVAAAVSL